MTAKLRSGNPLFAVLDSVSSYGSMPPGSNRNNASNPYRVHVDAGVTGETPVRCTLLIAGDSYLDTSVFTVVISEIRNVDPIPDSGGISPRYWAYDDVDSGYAERPDFSWVEVSGIGTMLSLSDDQTAQVDLPQGFVWRYYGQTNTQVSVCGNGWVAPGYITYSGYQNTALPNGSAPAMVALNWDDLYPPAGGGVWYYHDAANHRFVVEYDSVCYFSPREVWDKFELIIYDTTVTTPTGDNVLAAQYLTANGYSSNTVGLQDPTQSIAIQCLLEGSYHRGSAPLAAGRVVKYTTAGPHVGLAEETGNGLGRPAIEVRASPNPFTNNVILTATLAAPGRILATIYDNTGRLVRSLACNPEAAGVCRLTWNGTDEQGSSVAPGIYFYRLHSVDTGPLELKGRPSEAQAWGKIVFAR